MWSWLINFVSGIIALLLGFLAPAAVNSAEPEAVRPNLVIRDNVIEDSGFGVYVGWHGVWITEISGNLIVNNGEGIRIVNKAATIFDNVIYDNVIGVRVTSTHQGEVVTEVVDVSLSRNVIAGNLIYGIQNLTALTIDARDNWWGNPDGPQHSIEHIEQPADEDQIVVTPLYQWKGRTITLTFELPSLSDDVALFDLRMTFTRNLTRPSLLSLTAINRKKGITGFIVTNSWAPVVFSPLILRVQVQVAAEEIDYTPAEIRDRRERIFGSVKYTEWRTEEFSPIPRAEE